MTMNFFEPGDVPQPKENVKIEDVRVAVQPDRWRVQINIDVTPFRVRPNLAVALLRDLPPTEPPMVVGDMTIIETMHNKMEFTLHIRYVDDPAGDYVFKVRLYYEQGVHDPADTAEVRFSIPTEI